MKVRLSSVLCFVVVCLVAGFAFFLPSYLIWKHELPLNNFVGIRIPPVNTNQHNWDVGHTAALPYFLAAGIVAILGGIKMSLEFGQEVSSENEKSAGVFERTLLYTSILCGIIILISGFVAVRAVS